MSGRQHRILLVGFPPAQMLDISGPLDDPPPPPPQADKPRARTTTNEDENLVDMSNPKKKCQKEKLKAASLE